MKVTESDGAVLQTNYVSPSSVDRGMEHIGLKLPFNSVCSAWSRQ